MTVRSTALRALAACLALASTASGVTLYTDDFSGLGSAPLNGTAPDVRPGSETWTAGTLWFANGSKAASGNNNAWLPFSPYAGNRYTLSLDVNPNYAAGNSDWFALGFSASNSTTAVFQTSPNNTVAWILNRSDDSWGSGAFQSFLGPQTAGVQDHVIAKSGWVNLKVVLDTQPASWTAQWYVDNASVRGPVTFATTPAINYVGFGSYNSTQGFVDNFSLTSDFPHQPPPPLRRHYPLDDNAASSTVLDVAYGLNATYVAVNTNTRHVPGLLGSGALTLNGTSDYIRIDDGVDLNFGSGSSGGLTMAGWVKTTDLNGMLVSFRTSGDAGNPLVELGVWNGRPFGQIRDNNGAGLQTLQNAGPLINDNAWHHITVRRRTDGYLELYADGILVATSSSACTGAISTSVFRAIGSERRWVADNYGSVDGRYLSGVADDIGLWAAALSPREIAVIHALGVFDGFTLDAPDVQAMLLAFAGQTGVVLSNDQWWAYQTGLSGPTGTIGGGIASEDAYIVLDGALGAGMAYRGIVPGPASLTLLALGGLGLLARRRRKA